jgi:hypothetical protein
MLVTGNGSDHNLSDPELGVYQFSTLDQAINRAFFIGRIACP